MSPITRRQAGLARFRHRDARRARRRDLATPASVDANAEVSSTISSEQSGTPSSDSPSPTTTVTIFGDDVTEVATSTAFTEADGCAVHTIYPEVDCPSGKNKKQMRKDVESVLDAYKTLAGQEVLVDCATAGLFTY